MSEQTPPARIDPAAASVWLARLLPWLAFSVLILFFWRSNLAANDDFFVFGLDDAYIHLGLAQNLAQGHYGINLNEVSAPSSSIVWPFLLVPLTALNDPVLGLFGLCVLWGAVTVGVYQWFVGRILPDVAGLTQAMLVLVLLVATNTINLVFLGMEHGLQVATIAVIMAGLIPVVDEQRVPWWLVAALILAPLVRYEDLAVVLPVTLWLAAHRHWRAVGMVVLGVAITVGGFTAFLLANDLGPLPSSVVVKSDVAGADGIAGQIAGTVFNYFNNTTLTVGAMMVFVTAMMLGFARLLPNRRGLLLVGAAIGAAHLLFGSFGFRERYEIYAVAALMLLNLLILRREISQFFNAFEVRHSFLLLLLVMLTFNGQYVRAFLFTPEWRDGIYLQHYQVHRFVTDYWQRPIAVNDLGYVSYDNDAYILDLWGLGNDAAIQLRRDNEDDFNWTTDLMREHDVALALVYDEWFDPTPDAWIFVGKIAVQGRGDGQTAVSIYALDETTAAEVTQLLTDFAPTLPDETAVEWEP